MDNFADSITAARALPEEEHRPPSLFAKGAAPSAPLVREEAIPGQVPGTPSYKFKSHCQRFVIGRELTAIDENVKVYDPIDDSPALQEVLDAYHQGKAIITRRLETFLQNGTVVIWLEWATYDETPHVPPEERDYMTRAELLDPENPVARAAALLRKAAEETLTPVEVAMLTREPEPEPTPEEMEPAWGEASEGQGPDEAEDLEDEDE